MSTSMRWIFVAALLLSGAAPLVAQRPTPTPDVVVATGRGWYGFAYYTEPVRAGRGSSVQLVVERVVSGSPAAKVGLRAGDRIVAFDGRPITSERLESLQERVRPGEALRVRIRRDGGERDVRMVAEVPKPGIVVLGQGQAVAIRPDTVFHMMEVIMDSVTTAIGKMQVRVDSLPTPGQARMIVSFDDEGRPRLHGELVELEKMLSEQQRAAVANDLSARQLVELFRDQAADSVMARRALAAQLRARELYRAADTIAADTLLYRRAVEAAAGARWTPQGRGGTASWIYAGRNAWGGARFEEIGPQWRNALGVERGLLVMEVAEGTPAARAGLAVSDVITSAGGESVSTMGDLRKRLSDAGRDGLAIEVVRDKKRRALRLPPSR